MHHDNPYATWMPIVIIVVVMLLRSRSVGRERPFNMTLVWVLPAVAVLGIGAALAVHPPPLMGWMALAAGLALGVPLGWKRAKLTHIGRNEKGDLIIRHSAAAMLLLVGVIVLRQLARYEMMAAGATHGEWLALASDALMGFALGSIVTFRGELWIRARAILAS
ncbi:MAG: DUF1453 family protein [Sphingomonadales bacterium]|nr:DUF1453 family protein [Sphingomonadales bacterium]MDE2168587.1 DUF1453 family protein [Sphingomonadales bacterium]